MSERGQVVYRCPVHGTGYSKCCEQFRRVFPDRDELYEGERKVADAEMPRPETIHQILARARETATEREKQYGSDGYQQLAEVMRVFFPQGILLRDPEDFARFYLMEKIVEKLCRYVRSYTAGGHADSIHDLGIYSFKMEEHDSRNRHRR